MKSRAEREKEVKRWTTFLQKPNRPIPKPKSQLDAPYQEPYRVRIVKQPKPACDPYHVQTAPIDLEPISIGEIKLTDAIEAVMTDTDADTEQQDLDVASDEAAPESELVIDVEDDDVPDLMDCPDEICVAATFPIVNGNGVDLDKNIEGNSSDGENENGSLESNLVASDESTEMTEIMSPTLDPVLGKQLANVQQQLEALSHLPSTIQATLETITKQIAEMMPALQQRASIDWSADGTNPLPLAAFNEDNEPVGELISINANASEAAQSNELNPTTTGIDLSIETEQPSIEQPETPIIRPPIDMTALLASNVEEQVTKLKIEKCFEAQEEAWEREKKEKDVSIKYILHQQIQQSL